MLLTSGQISIAISSSIVFAFTTLLFLSGYILQQQTLHSLQAAIHPPPPPPAVLPAHLSRPAGHTFYDKYLASNRPKGGWAKVAYAQLVRSHVHVCNALMIFAELDAQDSLAQRILLYPEEWDRPLTRGSAEERRRWATTQRLLREAAKRYRALLKPMPAKPTAKDPAKAPSLSPEELYPLAPLLGLTHYTRLLYLPPSGLLLDASALDLLFTLPMTTSVLGLNPVSESGESAVLLFQASNSALEDALAALPEGAYLDGEFLGFVTTMPAPLTSPARSEKQGAAYVPAVLAESSSLAQTPEDFNATAFLEETAYVRLKDPGLPGPEFCSGRYDRQKPGGEGGRAWGEVYRRFGDGRMGICGVDLEVADSEQEKDARSDGEFEQEAGIDEGDARTEQEEEGGEDDGVQEAEGSVPEIFTEVEEGKEGEGVLEIGLGKEGLEE